MKNVNEFIGAFRAFLKQIFRTYDGIWVERLRKLNSERMFSAIISQTLDRKASNYRIIYDRILATNEKLTTEFSASSFSKARRRMPFDLFVDIAQWIYNFVEIPESNKWLGLNVFAIDSTSITLPKELEDEGFECVSSEDSEFPQAMATVVFDLQKGMPYDSVFSQHLSEREHAKPLLAGIPENSLLVCDRGFFAFDFLYDAEKEGVKILLRMPEASAPVELREFIKSEGTDEILTITLSKPTERKMIRRGYKPQPVTVRAIKYFIKGTRFIAITTLLDDRISLKTLSSLYWCRWDIEEFFKLCKCNLEIENFRAKHLQGVLQEFWAMQVLTNLARAIAILKSRFKTKVKNRVEISAFGVLKLLRTHLFQLLHCNNAELYFIKDRLDRALAKITVRFRHGRSFPRHGYS